MAELALKKLEEQLQCSICLDVYADPKQLQCNHVYCQKCLVRLVVRDQQGQLSLTCPICRQATPVPANGVAGLQSAFHINHILDIQDSLKTISLVAPATTTTVEGTVGRSDSEESSIKPCSDHKEELRLFCGTCKALICFQCAIKGSKHHSHEYEMIEKAYEKYKGEITKSLEPVEKHFHIVSKALADLDARCGEISKQQSIVEADIDDHVRKLHEFLDMRKTELIGQLHQVTQAKLKDLAVQRDQIETTQAQISSCLECVTRNLETGNPSEMLLIKDGLLAKVKELTTSLQPDTLRPSSEANMKLFLSADTATFCQYYGKIITPEIDPSNCHLTDDNIPTATVGAKSSVFLQAVDFRGQPCEESIYSMNCKLVSEVLDTAVVASVQRKGESQYEISYTPTVKGPHQLHILVEDQHVKGSPFCTIAALPVEDIKSLILAIDSVHTPVSVALNQQGHAVVIEQDRQCIIVFQCNGERLQSFGDTEGNMVHPCGLAVDHEDNILVIDDSTYQVVKFSPDGKFMVAVDTCDSGGSLIAPRGIAVNSANQKIYIIFYNCVQVLNPDLTKCASFGSYGVQRGSFNSPSGIACDGSGKVYVTDPLNHHILIFTAEGEFLKVIGGYGREGGDLSWPVAVAVDSDNCVYVSDSSNCCVSIFTSEGEFVTSFGNKGAGPGQFNNPRSLAVDGSGIVYVCDLRNNTIQLF